MGNQHERWASIGVAALAVFVALISAQPYAGGWNDGSRLATVESLVDRGTLAIDYSVFAKRHDEPSPYRPNDLLSRRIGTGDKLFIKGHYYSDKSPVPACGMASVYQIWIWLGGPTAAERPNLFCLLMNLITSTPAYIIAVWCLFAIGRRIGLDLAWRLALTFFFAIGTIALPYAQYVNNHILLLGVAAWLFLLLLKCEQEGWTRGRMFGIGTLLGFGYSIDLAAGPMLCVAVGGLLLVQSAQHRLIAILAGLPWFLLHHAVNYHTGGTFGPANAVPAYLAWPGSSFNPGNATGGWKHATAYKAVTYALDMLFGKKGFLGHDLPLLLLLFVPHRLLARAYPERRIVVTGFIWSVGTWLIYSASSNNLSGACCSIRWFVPLLFPGFMALAVLLRDYPSLRTDAAILGVGGVLEGMIMGYVGPWIIKMVPVYWPIYGGTVFAWGVYRASKLYVAMDWGVRFRPRFASRIVRNLFAARKSV